MIEVLPLNRSVEKHYSRRNKSERLGGYWTRLGRTYLESLWIHYDRVGMKRNKKTMAVFWRESYLEGK